MIAAISWWPLAATVLHIVEEFVFPGGFADWDRRYRPAIRSSITGRFHVLVNGLLLFACLAVGLLGPTPRGVAGWLTVAALLVSNAVFHVVGSIRTRSYSPGVVTAVALYVPIGIYGFAHFLGSRQASVGAALAALAIGGSYPLWSSVIHARRARRAGG